MGDSRTTIRMMLRLFGPESERAGSSEIEIELEDGARARDVLLAAERACPALAGRVAHCRVAANHAFAAPDAEIRAGDELALVGLVSGG